MKNKMTHHEESVLVDTSPQQLFAYIDDHTRLTSHMNDSSWMMGGGRMNTEVDSGLGKRIGSHIRMNGKILGMNLFLDEIVTQHEPPHLKVWQTVGNINLLVIGHYEMGIKIKGENEKSRYTVFINYELPSSPNTRWLGYLFGDMYAKWCVKKNALRSPKTI